MAAEVPKQYLQVAGATLLEHSLRALLGCQELQGVVVVLDPTDRRADRIDCLSMSELCKRLGGTNARTQCLRAFSGWQR